MSRLLITASLLVIACAIGSAQEATPQSPANAPELKTLEEQAAYALGFDFGKDMLANGPEFNPDLIARGLIDAMRKAKPLLTEEQQQKALDHFMAKQLGPGAEK